MKVGGGLGGIVARVAIAKWIGERDALRIDADVVYGPAIDGDGADAFGSEGSALAEAIFDAANNALEVPAQASIELAGIVREPMDETDGGTPVRPAQERDAAAFGAEIDRD